MQRLTAQLIEAHRLMAKDPEGAVRLLNAMLDDPKAHELADRSPIVQVYREEALYIRGRAQLRQGQAQTVADDMSVLLDRKRARFLSRVAGLAGAWLPLAARPSRRRPPLPPS